MTKNLHDHFLSVTEKFHKARKEFEFTHESLKQLEKRLLEYTDSYQDLPDEAEYIGEGAWRAWDHTICGRLYSDECDRWKYDCEIGGKVFTFEQVSECVAFLAGYSIATNRHEEEARAKTSHLTQPE